jgi:preprotein translocase subunit YajC
MEINWTTLGIVAAVLIVLIVFMIRKNQKEKRKLTEFLNNDFKKSEEDEPDVDNTANER